MKGNVLSHLGHKVSGFCNMSCGFGWKNALLFSRTICYTRCAGKDHLVKIE